MKRVRQILACYLALCFALAGAVGISPVLHRLIEHGNHGPAHTHRGNFTRTPQPSASHGHEHTHPHPHSHGHDHAHGEHSHRKRVFAHEHEFRLPRIPLAQLWHALTHFLAGDEEDSPESPSPENREHHHDSLPQLLASGLVEQVLDSPLLESIPVRVAFLLPPSDVALIPREWNAQTASRAPPSAQS